MRNNLKIIKSKLIFIFVFLLIINMACAEVEVIKQADKNFRLGDEVKVTIKIANKGSLSSFEIKERLPNDIELINPKEPNQITYLNGIEARFLKYNLEIPENKIGSIEYSIKPKSLGSYTISPTSVISDSVYTSNSVDFNVYCVPDNKCDHGENNLYCKEDCSLSVSDGICNPKSDSVCDPDCDSDPDCKNPKSSLFSSKYLLIPLAIILVIIIIYFLYRLLKRNKHPILNQFSQQPAQQTKENDMLKGL